jgi:hypothetical protein
MASNTALVSVAQQRNASVLESFGATTLENETDATYSEDAFRYFLDIERKRAEASNRPLLLLLIDVLDDAGRGSADQDSAGLVLAALNGCLRDTDLVGWYHEARVLGAVLTQRGETPVADASGQVIGRVNRALAFRLPADITARLQVRVFELASKQAAERALEEI